MLPEHPVKIPVLKILRLVLHMQLLDGQGVQRLHRRLVQPRPGGGGDTLPLHLPLAQQAGALFPGDIHPAVQRAQGETQPILPLVDAVAPLLRQLLGSHQQGLRLFHPSGEGKSDAH